MSVMKYNLCNYNNYKLMFAQVKKWFPKYKKSINEIVIIKLIDLLERGLHPTCQWHSKAVWMDGDNTGISTVGHWTGWKQIKSWLIIINLMPVNQYQLIYYQKQLPGLNPPANWQDHVHVTLPYELSRWTEKVNAVSQAILNLCYLKEVLLSNDG